MTVTKSDIIKELRRLGLGKGDIVIAHSALSAFGRVTGGAAAVVRALLDTIGPEGTLLMPSLPAPGHTVYDARKTPTGMGAIAEHFRNVPGVVRSRCPCVPAAGLGPRAAALIEHHETCESPYINSPYDLAAREGGYVLLLGVDQDRNTTLHCAEALARMPYMNPACEEYVDRHGRVKTYRGILYAGPHRNFIAVDPLLKKAGLMKVGKIGSCVVRLMKGQALLDFCVAELRKDPTLFLTKNDGYRDGIELRGKVRAARIAAEESFTLIAQTAFAGANMAEVFWHAHRAGASALEVDRVNGCDVSALSDDALALLKKEVASANLRTAVVRSRVLTDSAFERTLAAGRALDAEAIIAPLVGTPQRLKHLAALAAKAGMRPLFENVAAPWSVVRDLLKALDAGAELAFNPAHFAAAGQLPFLQCFHPLKSRVRYVAVSDASPLGAPCLPGCGYGEIKEILSILRCASYGGFVSLASTPAPAVDFDAASDAFYRLLDES